LNVMVKLLIDVVNQNKNEYIANSSLEEYEWGLQSAICARQNVVFLEGYHRSERNQSTREKFMLENLEWILKRENNRQILLFGHLVHMAKDIENLNAEGIDMVPENYFGEHIAEKYGADYAVIGDFYSYLDYGEEMDSVSVNSLPSLLNQRYSKPRFYMSMDKTDSLFNKPRIIAVPNSRGDLWMTPTKGVDLVFYTKTQHYFYKE
jgi:hypothetical protein